MKITKRKLKQIIKEELDGALAEEENSDQEVVQMVERATASFMDTFSPEELSLIADRYNRDMFVHYLFENIELQKKITEIPKELIKYNLEIDEEHMSLIYTYNVGAEKTGITDLLQDLKDTGLKLRDLKTEQSNLEKIFVNLVRENNEI